MRIMQRYFKGRKLLATLLALVMLLGVPASAFAEVANTAPVVLPTDTAEPEPITDAAATKNLGTNPAGNGTEAGSNNLEQNNEPLAGFINRAIDETIARDNTNK